MSERRVEQQETNPRRRQATRVARGSGGIAKGPHVQLRGSACPERSSTMLARAGVLALLVLLGWLLGASPVLSAAAPTDALAVADLAIRDGHDRHPAVQRQGTDTEPGDQAEPATAEALGRIAALTMMLDQQGARSAGNLERVASTEVLNLTAGPEYVVDAREGRAAASQASAAAAATIEAMRAAEAEAETKAAVAAALAADQVGDEAEVAAVVATQEAEASAAVAAALAADKKDDDAQVASLAATREAEVAASDATVTAEAEAAASTLQAAETATARAEARAEAAVASNRQFVQRATMLSLSLSLLLLSVGFLCLRFWRNRKEPFVLKANPGSGSVHAHA